MGNPLCHFELMVMDPGRAKEFYGKVFDWTFQSWGDDAPMEYDMVDTGAEPGGGMMKKPAEAPHPALSVYFLVDDVDATLAKAQEAGGTMIVPKMEIPGIGWHGMFMDPDGIPVGVFQEMPKQE